MFRLLFAAPLLALILTATGCATHKPETKCCSSTGTEKCCADSGSSHHAHGKKHHH